MEGERMQDCCGNALTCSSQEALELYNKALESFVSYKDDCMDSLKRIIELDENFVMAHCLLGCLMADTFDPAVQVHLDAVTKLYPKVLEREQRHIDAFFALSQGNTPKSNEILANIGVNYPRDLHAARWAFGDYFKCGEWLRLRSHMAQAVTHCPVESNLYPYILSLYAFGLEETNERDLAEELCYQSLAIDPHNPWATHTLAHIIEEVRDAQKGIDFLISTRKNWQDHLLGHHTTWHLTLYYFDLNQTDKILQEFDTIMAPCAKNKDHFDLLDTASLLWRLNVMGIDPGQERWKLVTDAFQTYIDSPQRTWLETAYSWLSAHLMMSLCHSKVSAHAARLALARQAIKNMEEYAAQSTVYDASFTDMVGIPVCNAMLAYGEEKYDEVISLMLPLKFDFVKLGGSWAQRQVLELTLIMAAINGNQLRQAEALIIELKDRKPRSKGLQRLHDQVRSALKKQ